MASFLRGCALFVVFFVLVAQVLASLFETGFYAAEKVYMDNNDLFYTKGWQYYFKWVVKPLSAVMAIFLLVSTLCSCVFGGPDRRTRQGGRGFPGALGVVSAVLVALWTVICVYQMRDGSTVTSIVNTSVSSGMFVYPLGQGFSLKNDCNASPFTLVEHGTTACQLLKAESAVAFACLGLWALTLVLSTLLCCIVGRRRSVAPTKEGAAMPGYGY
ncbi:hypothetical protein GGI04_000626 [Coemansia thaxteri]|uniref:Uncharacterized protein n=1 Tax=Coemansia thaxteri TaxID=2663907 RepID=A0A9W8EHS0_9FUNG|nr:hypothetical protein H4R26_004242 [Coemansia thaxteri]KAJ2009246.1 hypothetical protein GGI04_000626 [Coemansia thaxteri]KAJ2474165.1 hypothetical protein GGI02_000292 [Coemansia sp. RSA 2322]KAJ2476945.1 hypothetical protein EV174_004771 [Coemansia sp. RSA 2320]